MDEEEQEEEEEEEEAEMEEEAGADSDADDSDSDVSSGVLQRRRGDPAVRRALSALSSKVLERLLDALAGPEENPHNSRAGLRGRRMDVRQSIRRGCISLRKDFWGPSPELVSRSKSFEQLTSHQRVGVRWLLAMQACSPGAILADEMGLGKTATTLCFLELLGSARPSVVIAPGSLLSTWETEAARWTPSIKTFRYHSSDPAVRDQLLSTYSQDPGKYQLIITTPQALNNRVECNRFFRRVRFEYLICDEAHGFKNASSIRHRDVLKHIKCSQRLLLTGTPVQNNLTELTSLLGFALHSSKDTRGLSAELAALSSGPLAVALRQVQTAAAPFILRRLKADVLADLPEKTAVVVHCDMQGEQLLHYQEVMREGRSCKRVSNAYVKEAFHRLHRVCLHPLLARRRFGKEQYDRYLNHLIKVRPDFARATRVRVEEEVNKWNDFDRHTAALEYGLPAEFHVQDEDLHKSAKVKELIRILQEQISRGDKTLVFSQYTQLLDIVQAALVSSKIRHFRLDGKVSLEDRAKIVQEFQTTSEPLTFLISLKAGGVGLNLTAANVVVMLDVDWNPHNLRQAEDRVHRLGQTRTVTVYYLICRNTVEEMVLKRCVQKMRLDQHFGGRQGALEAAAARAAREPLASGAAAEEGEGEGGALEEEKEPAAAEEEEESGAVVGKKIEGQVFEELKELLRQQPEAAAPQEAPSR